MLEYLFGSKLAGFLSLHHIDESYMGSFLITDYDGMPMEFRCTHPLRPNAVQVSLYGEKFLSHVGVELCGKPLLRAIKNKPKLIFVDKSFLLGLNDHSSCPIIFVKAADQDHPIYVGPQYQVEVIRPDTNFGPFEIAKRTDTKTQMTELAEQLCTQFDVLEPFQRMEKAVEIIAQQKVTLK